MGDVTRSNKIYERRNKSQSPDHTLEAVDKQQWLWPLLCGLQGFLFKD
jgi:hypothetical protein